MTDEIVQDELTSLKARADQMGIKYHPKIGLEKLRIKVNNAIQGQGIESNEEEEIAVQAQNNVTPIKRKRKVETQNERNARLRREASRLVRVRVNCMNPNKSDYEGEIFTVSNAIVGTFKKYVPYNNEEGWHIPEIIYKHLLERECQIFVDTRGPRGEKMKKGKLIKEFAIEVLPDLTQEELKELAQRQAMSGSIDN